MATLWFVIAAAMIVTYVLLDGFDLGAGIVHHFVARTEGERALVLRSIGPVWDGNEVWLLAGGGVLVLAFPPVYAAAFSGFYLPLMLVLWLLIGRGCAIEFRHQMHGPLWTPLWDRVFSISSALLAVCFGAALGNVVRGVPLDRNGQFFEPLWTHFLPSGDTGVLDLYTVGVGVAALVALAMHGALWLAVKLEGEVQRRARALARRLLIAVGLLTLGVTAASLSVQPHALERLKAQPWIFGCAALAVAGLAGVRRFSRRGDDRKAFASSCAYLAGMLTSAAFSLYPFLLPSNGAQGGAGLSVDDSAASPYALSVGLWWWVPGIALAVAYQVFTYRQFRGKVRPEEAGY